MTYTFRKSMFVGALLLAAIPVSSRADTLSPLSITEDTVWTAAASPYVIPSDVTVAAGATLRMEPGVEVRFENNGVSSMYVKGGIVAEGTDEAPIVIQHGGIILEKDALGVFRHVDIGLAARCISGEYATLLVEDSVVSDCDQGIALSRGTFTLMRTVFRRTIHAISTDLLSTFTHAGNSIFDSKLYTAIEMGTVSAPQAILAAGDLPYMLVGSYFNGLSTLTIEPGVTVSMVDYGQGTVLHLTNGQKILAHGTPEARITFDGPSLFADTSAVIDLSNVTFAPRTTSAAAVTVAADSSLTADTLHIESGGVGVTVSDQSTARISNSVLNNLDVGLSVIHGGLVTVEDSQFIANNIGVSSVLGGTVSLRGVTISDSKKYGIVLGEEQSHEAVSALSMHGSHLVGNTVGLYIWEGTVSAPSNDIHGNGVGVDAAVASTAYDMRHSWWGSESGPQQPLENPHGEGDIVSPYISVAPWLGHMPSGDESAEPPVENTPPQGHEPVILVPGIMGTELFTDEALSTEVWPAIDKLILSPLDTFLEALSLRTDGTPDPIHPMRIGDIIRSTHPPIGPTVDTFDGLIAAFTAAGYKEGRDLFVFPYDWRLSVFADAPLLKEKIDAVLAQTGKHTVNVIAHSMGGLVAKAYIAQYGAEAINNLIFIGTPHLGAPKAIKTLLYGDDMGGHAGPLHILSPERVKSISHYMPSAYELLPSARYDTTAAPLSPYVAGNTGLVLGQNHETTRTFLVQHLFTSALLEQAEATHERLDQLNLASTRVYNFAGCSDSTTSKTIGGIVIGEHTVYSDIFGAYGTKQYRPLYVNGDETVPLSSAQSVSGSQYYIHGASHGRLPSAGDVPQALLGILSGVPFGATATVATDPARCGVSGTVVSTHGPVELHVYDSLSRHTGLTASGDIEQSIPGVAFDMIEKSTSVFLPDDQVYSVFVRPVSDGLYDAYISRSDMSDTIVSQSYFSQLHTLDTLGTTRIDYLGADMDEVPSLFEQRSEDGVGVSLRPSSVLSGPALFDAAPPTTTATVENTTVTLNAVDELSGVLRTDYSLDGYIWQRYTEPFIVSENRTISYASTDNAGNTEDAKTLAVDIPEATIPAVPESAPVQQDVDTIRGTPPIEKGEIGIGGDTALDQALPLSSPPSGLSQLTVLMRPFIALSSDIQSDSVPLVETRTASGSESEKEKTLITTLIEHPVLAAHVGEVAVSVLMSNAVVFSVLLGVGIGVLLLAYLKYNRLL